MLGLEPGDATAAQRRPAWPHARPAFRRRPGQPDHRDGPAGDQRLRRRGRPAAQRLDHPHGDRLLPRRRRPNPRRQGDTGDPHGHNKDYRPDLKQLLFILTVSADGAVPIAYRVADGNTVDDVTHIPTWDELRALVGRADFCYVADSKLCSKEAMGHIASHGGRFVTVVPHGRREDTWFRDWAQTHAPAWVEADRRPGARLGDPDRVWRTFEAPAPSTDG